MNRDMLTAIALSAVGVLLRWLAVPLSVVHMNPYSTTDARSFATTAVAIASWLAGSELHLPRTSHVYKSWGGILSPFWLLPGPSKIYALLTLSLLGGLIIWNVYWITRKYGTRQAAILSVLPLLIYPSFVLSHASLLREATVLAGITTVARLLIAPPPREKVDRTVIAGFGLVAFSITTLLRLENAVLYLGTFVVALIVWRSESRDAASIHRLGTFPALVFAAVVLQSTFVSRGVDYLTAIRRARAHGRAVYLQSVDVVTALDVAIYAPVGALYFLLAPFPWMIGTPADFTVYIQSLGNILYFAFAPWGFRRLFRRHRSVAVGLAVFLLMGAVLYGIVETNYGAAVRHRMMFTWIMYVMGAIGFSQQFKVIANS